MKTSLPTSLLLSVAILAVLAVPAPAESPILPKGWISLEQLERVEDPLQKQLDTGIGMNGTAWDMATVKDAELLVVYLTLFEKLADRERAALLKEQEAWMKQRSKAAAKADDGKSGSMGRLMVAAAYQDWTTKRISALKKRLPKQ